MKKNIKKEDKQKWLHRLCSDPLERRWTVWILNGEKVDVITDEALFYNGVLSLHNNAGQVAQFGEFRAAIQCSHCNFGLDQYWVNDGMKSHVVEANRHSWDGNGMNVFIQSDFDKKIERLVAVFPHAAWWVHRDSRLWPDLEKCTDKCML